MLSLARCFSTQASINMTKYDFNNYWERFILYYFRYFRSRMILVNITTSPAVLNAPTNVAMNISMIFLCLVGILTGGKEAYCVDNPDRFF